MKCSRCGSELREGKKFCPKCGKKVTLFPFKKIVIVAVIIVAVGVIGFLGARFGVISRLTSDEMDEETQNTTSISAENNEGEQETTEINSENTDGKETENQEDDQDIAAEEQKDETSAGTLGYIPIVGSQASSELQETKRGIYEAAHLYDNNLDTPWCEAVDGAGFGEWVRLDFGNEYAVTELEIYNGFMESSELLNSNAQLCDATLTFSDGTEQKITCQKNADLNNPVVIELDEPVVTTSIKLTINSVHYGSQYTDTCISEIRVVGYGENVELPSLYHGNW